MKMNFNEALLLAYRKKPCQVLPNALWKTWARLETLQTSMESDQGVVTHLKAWDEMNLMVYWTRNREQTPDLSHLLSNMSFALLHEDYLQAVPSARFATRKPYFRLVHKHNNAEVRSRIPAGFSLRDVNILEETQKVSELIGQCYPDIRPTIEEVMSWAAHPVFDPALWVWVIDDTKSLPIGLGIAEIDNTVPEASLEWIQVLPPYRGFGIGKGMVQELLSRLGRRVKFTTVAGEVDNKTNPEALYRVCGFTGNDTWWMLAT